jgi:hypothetical protein
MVTLPVARVPSRSGASGLPHRGPVSHRERSIVQCQGMEDSRSGRQVRCLRQDDPVRPQRKLLQAADQPPVQTERAITGARRQRRRKAAARLHAMSADDGEDFVDRFLPRLRWERNPRRGIRAGVCYIQGSHRLNRATRRLEAQRKGFRARRRDAKRAENSPSSG